MRSMKKSKTTWKEIKICTHQCKIWDTEYSPEKDVHSITGLPKEAKKSHINNLAPHLNELEK